MSKLIENRVWGLTWAVVTQPDELTVELADLSRLHGPIAQRSLMCVEVRQWGYHDQFGHLKRPKEP
jgi:hypothetical protein